MTRFRNLLDKVRQIRSNDSFTKEFGAALFGSPPEHQVASRPEKRLLPSAGRPRISHRRIEA
jgi:hypothetical protein